MKPYKQLTYEQRCQIEALKKSGFSQADIAAAIGLTQSTVTRELKRNIGLRGYRHKQVQTKTDERRRQARKAIKMTADVITVVESKLQEKWSPEQVSAMSAFTCMSGSKNGWGATSIPTFAGRARNNRSVAMGKRHAGK